MGRNAHGFQQRAKFKTVSPLSLLHCPSNNFKRPIETCLLQSNYRENWDWQGDDIRPSTRFQRRFRYSLTGRFTDEPGKQTLILINTFLFLYQTVSTVNAIRRRHPSYWPNQAGTMLLDSLLGASVVQGRLTADFVHSAALSSRQPHRFLTAGFLHGSLLHFVLNMDTLRRMPSWLETGLGTPLFLTAYLVSIVTGNWAHSFGLGSSNAASAVLGASGGLTGLYGLMYVCLVRMGNPSSAWMVLRGMLWLFLYGMFVPNISNAAHVGGFVGGILVGLLFGPTYVRSYEMRRKWSTAVDDSPPEYRRVMGFGSRPASAAWLPLSAFWACCLLAVWVHPPLRAAPSLVMRGLLKPGSASRALLLYPFR